MRMLFRRRVIVILLLLIQAASMFFMVWSGSQRYEIVSAALTLLSLTVSLYIVNCRDKPAYKLTWVLFIMTMPVFGGLFYLIFKLQSSAHNLKKLSLRYNEKAQRYLKGDPEVRKAFELDSPYRTTQVDYLYKTVGFPVYSGTEAEYLSPGERQYERMLQALERAERFIFLEFFILEAGEMWNGMLSVLKRKVDEGVDVRLIYDDVGCFLKLPLGYDRELRRLGIKCAVFNPFHPFWSTVQNNRDHRKIVVIDGHTAFTGGINIADEYINRVERFGHWKDAGVMLRGPAVDSFTVMFLSMWELIHRTDEDYSPYLSGGVSAGGEELGYVQPWCDSPLDDENVGEHVYLQIINKARKYIYITTPYLIVDDNMISALRLAAKSGVDVRIVTPHVPDKKLVHATTRSYYGPLVEAGVRVYEYTPGFLHSKTFISDDETAVIGTANLDFRSLYLHFECGAWIHKNRAVLGARDDFLNMLCVCTEIAADGRICRGNVFMRILRLLLRITAPLL